MATHTPDQLTNIAAIKLIEDTGISILEAALLVHELYQGLGGRGKSIMRARMCIQLGKKELHQREKTVSFRQGVEETLRAKQHRRPRTLAEINYICTRLMNHCPELGRRPLRAIRMQECANCIRRTFPTLRQQRKARVILSGVFSTAFKHGWCEENPALQIELPPLHEQTIHPLTIREIQSMFHSARQLYGNACIPPLGLMLYAGIRPAEVERLTWNAVNLEERVVCLKALHSKTGGSRQVQIHPVLHQLLKDVLPLLKETPVCPPNWKEKWKRIRHHAGWSSRHGNPWIQDVLRHTYASYHAKQFRNFTELQYEMGHSGLHLLKSRYLNMQDISRKDASRFWSVRETGPF
ncbi:tyrosine-type recombinase/integrase [Akkermansia sp.]|uniref:tyrosine-type recombinase/integrase n=1 Tax=Akkermansia sp. TaxID=1872421 RepID=UPI0025B9D375|nr:tyrosine-type recombinase/integrase [Akkermansia sp.]MCC8147505.1 tyrosine-type recombinase/integrase [Akkermansia sp.]